MQSELLFQETQRFRAWWLWCLFAVVAALLVYRTLHGGTPLDSNEKLGLWIALGATAAVVGLFAIMRLDTEIRKDGVHVRFFPFHIRFKHYPWRQLKQARIRKYSALFEYGGWGLRGFGNDRALNVSGNTGIQLETTRGKKLLIGTRRPDEAGAAINGAFNPPAYG